GLELEAREGGALGGGGDDGGAAVAAGGQEERVGDGELAVVHARQREADAVGGGLAGVAGEGDELALADRLARAEVAEGAREVGVAGDRAVVVGDLEDEAGVALLAEAADDAVAEGDDGGALGAAVERAGAAGDDLDRGRHHRPGAGREGVEGQGGAQEGAADGAALGVEVARLAAAGLEAEGEEAAGLAAEADGQQAAVAVELLAEEAALDDEVDAVARAGVGDEVDLESEGGGDPVGELGPLAGPDDRAAQVGVGAELEVDGDHVADRRVLDR